MKRPEKGRALFYTRDSGGKHEMTPSQYVRWAQREADGLGLEFRGTPEEIDAMILEGRSADGDIFLDYGVKGNTLSRDGLDALIETATKDLNVSHVLPASQVAKVLTDEGVPTPDHGRSRTDNGVRHLTSGAWHQGRRSGRRDGDRAKKRGQATF